MQHIITRKTSEGVVFPCLIFPNNNTKLQKAAAIKAPAFLPMKAPINEKINGMMLVPNIVPIKRPKSLISFTSKILFIRYFNRIIKYHSHTTSKNIAQNNGNVKLFLLYLTGFEFGSSLTSFGVLGLFLQINGRFVLICEKMVENLFFLHLKSEKSVDFEHKRGVPEKGKTENFGCVMAFSRYLNSPNREFKTKSKPL